MPFYMNPFNQEYKGMFPQVDHHAFPKPLITYTIPNNKNNSVAMIAWKVEPYDFSSLPDLTINYAVDANHQFFAALTIDVSGATAAATTAAEVATALNANAIFTTLFKAKAQNIQETPLTASTQSVLITSKKPNDAIKAYISNSSAESKLRFNLNAGIAEIPTYFSKDNITNYHLANSAGQLIELDGTDTAIDRPIIRDFLNNQAWTNADLLEDWQMLEGRGGRFKFTINTINGDGQITDSIQWGAGAIAGDMAVRIIRVWGGATDTSPDEEYEVPHVLTSTDVANVPTL
tara:strand:+ start:26322 stop:27191 length:870 start_codon:yes stop_codon:yes gene_type:complete